MKFLVILLVISTAAYAAENDEAFSIGLGVLSPSYSQTVGKENVKVKFDQKEDGGFSYSVGDPGTGSSSYNSFGAGAAAGYAGSTGYAGYQAPASNSGYQAPASNAGYQAPSINAGYSGPSNNAYGGYGGNAYSGSSGYNSPSSGYNAPSSGYNGPSSGYEYGSERKQQDNPSQIIPSMFSYHATDGQAYLNGAGSERKPQDPMGGLLPSQFSYHATEGQSYLSQGGGRGEERGFLVSDSKQSTGPAQQSFQRRGQSGGQSGVQIGGYAGPQYQGVYEEKTQ